MPAMPDEHTIEPAPKKKRKQPPAAERRLQAQRASNASWASTPRTADRQARTLPARNAFNSRFEQQVDPNGDLTPEERQVAAEHARKAYFQGLSLKSAQARRRRS